MDMEQINFTRESVQARADAVKVAGEVAGTAEAVIAIADFIVTGARD